MGHLKGMKGIKGRWMFNSLGIVVLVILLGVGTVSIAMADYYYSNIRTSLLSRAEANSRFFGSYINKNYNEYYVSAYRFSEEFPDRNKLELQFINQNGRIDISTTGLTAGTVPNTPDISEALSTGGASSWTGTEAHTGERIMSVSSPLVFSNKQIIGVMRYVTSLHDVDRQVLMITLVAVAIGAVIVLIVSISNLYFIRSIVDPVRKINEITRKIASGSYGARIDAEYDDEIGELAETINEMSAEISRAERLKTDFISSVSHELRTPLTAIAGWGETLLSPDMDNLLDVKKGIRIMLKESRRLTKLVEELLEFTRMEGGRMTMHMETIDIEAEFEESVYMYMDLLRKEDLVLEYFAGDDIPQISGDRERLKQVFYNLFDNAAKHGKEGGKITASIDFEPEHGQIVIRIQDFGPGIPEDELPLVKRKFYKGSSKARGSGIGLAISDEIIKLHDGEFEILSALGEGTTAVIRLPAAINYPAQGV